ncbi:hypothetical protein AGABI2DRAFT_116035 [Agaricus bisporus var. bisporus H97]|uniref:hypothetical protein n=1 Tax=Agaricus bisporus var. bisporus (strain H97 / ATCC MYA-4626 / FGSC 10389) TaxID=936046 RepID=UPI00029F71C0|nr:hypothetical protein AGABI2DRAFT_116035 [Agaricus bisporus var. bisporus H97]EKV48993.1 hypothetical protein AGABI2DRAFT_116035 [Agaricus bisporus var. bisporus H97]
MSPTAVTFNDLSLPPNGPGSLSSLQYWMEGFTLQTLVYGINIVLFLSTMWVLGIHIFKALAHTHKFHRLHLWQNYVLTVYTVVMFALSSIFMGRQGIMADGAWQSVFREEGIDGIAENIFSDDAAPRRVCHAALILINWGTVAILMWRCAIYWKVRSTFPWKIMALPYLVFATSIATCLLDLLQEGTPSSLSASAGTINWRLISWSICTALYYLLALLIWVRMIYNRRIMKTEVGDAVYKLAGNLTIFNESGVVLVVFATAYLIALARFPHLVYLFQALVTQIQVMTALFIVQRVTGGKSWSGKIVDCVLLQDAKPEAAAKEDVTTMGFNPNTQVSCSQDDDSNTSQFDKTQEPRGQKHDVALELRAFGDNV